MPSAPSHPRPKADVEPSNAAEADQREDTHLTIKPQPRPIPVALANKLEQKSPKRSIILLSLAAALIVGTIGGYVWITRNQETTDDAQVEADVVPVGSRLFGQVERLLVTENQTVKAGQLLVLLDASDVQAKRDQAQADLDTAKAQSDAADAQVRLTEASAKGGLATAKAAVTGSTEQVQSSASQIAAAEAAVKRAEADAERSRLDLERTRQLLASNAATPQQWEHDSAVSSAADAALEEAKARLNAAQETRSVALSQVAQARGHLDQTAPIESQIGMAVANSALAHAKVRSAKAQLKLAELQLSYAKITAPADGRVSRVAVHEGQLVQAGQAVAEFVPNATYVVANFKETQIGRIRPGQRADISLDAFPGRTFRGTVESESSGTGARFALLPPDNASGNFVKVVQRVPVRIRWLEPPSVPLQAGLSADATIYVR
jgi:membrane fusion protein (multidrug efflux system)